MNITDFYGLTLPSNAEAQSIEKTESVDAIKIPGADGECKKLLPSRLVKVEVSCDYVGSPAFADIAPADNVTTSVLTPVSASMTENVNKENAGKLSATKYVPFEDGGGDLAGGADTDIGDIVIKSVSHSLIETVTREVKVDEKIIPDSDGTPGFRGMAMRMGTFAVKFFGDVFAGIVIGGETGLSAFSGGVRVVTKSAERQKTGEVNSGEYSGDWAPNAS